MKLILFFATWLCLSVAFSDDVIGVVSYISGDVKVNANPIEENDKIHVSDTIETGENSRVQVIMVDENIVQLNSNSKVNFKEYEFDEHENRKWSLFDLIYGSIRSLVNQKYKNEDGQGYQINTPAGVIGVRGTDFLVEHLDKDQRTEVTSFSGEVTQGERGIGRKIRNSIRIGPGQFMQLFAGRRAFARAQKQEAKRFEFLRDTTSHSIEKNHRAFRQIRVYRQKNRKTEPFRRRK